jgi:cyanophycinase
MDRAILNATGEEHPRVLVVPTAAARQGPSKAASNGVDYFSGLGARASALMVMESAGANDEGLLAPVGAAHVIYLTGGDPGHLLDTLIGSLLLEKLKDAHQRGAILAGSSAGAMVLGSWMRFGGWTQALGFVDGIAVLPHHEGSGPARVAKELGEASPSGLVVVGIDAKVCCFGRAGGWEVLGPGGVTLYSQGRWRRYEPGQVVPLHSFTNGS